MTLKKLALSQIQLRGIPTLQLDEASLRKIAEGQASELLSLCCFEPGPNIREQITTMLAGIVKTALEVATLLMSSKALFLVVWPSKNCRFRTWKVPEVEILEGDPYDYTECTAVRPALLKWGNAEGEKYDQSMVVCPPIMVFSGEPSGTE